MPTTGSPLPGRRVSTRLKLAPPPEVRLVHGEPLPPEASVPLQGWLVDQQDDGLGLRLGGEDAERLLADPSPWCVGPVDLELAGLALPDARLPVRIVHATPREGSRRDCRVGLVYDSGRMKPDEVARLLRLWTRSS